MDQKKIPQTLLDQMVTSDRDQLLKAAVPYLPPQGQQMVSVLSKFQELTRTMKLFSPDRQGMQACSIPVSDPVEVLQELREFSYGQSRQQLDQLTNLMALAEMMKLMNA